jgi:hypothetical protein
MTSELEEAWNALWDVLPPGWTVERPVYHLENGGDWVAYCRDTRYRKDKATPPYWEAIGPTEADSLR